MAQFSTGGLDVMEAMAFGAPHPNTLNFIQQSLMQPTVALTDAGARFMSTVKDLYEKVSGSTAIRTAEAIRHRIGSLFQENEIRYLERLSEIQNAPTIMQRYIMAEPTIRAAYHRQEIDGYSHSYVDVEPGQVGKDHYDYRRVMDGVIELNDDGSWSSTTYFDELHENDRPLTLLEKDTILNQWDTVSGWYKQFTYDPTSVWNATLG